MMIMKRVKVLDWLDIKDFSDILASLAISYPKAVPSTHAPCAEIDKKKCAGHRSTPIYEQSSAPPLKAPRGLQGGPLQSESIHSSLDIFKGSGHQKCESVFREFILRLELLSANYITTHLKLLSYSFECL